jgi:hypothetical protein
MCAEHDPLTCHRTILVCRHLKKTNSNIFHILRNSEIESHEETERRLIREERQQIDQVDMFAVAGPDAALSNAYKKRGDRIAYRKEVDESEDTHNRFY